MLRLIYCVLLLTIAGLCVYEIGQRETGVVELEFDPLTRSKALFSSGDFVEARHVARFLTDNPELATNPDDIAAAHSLIDQSNVQIESFRGKLGSFIEGAVTGEPRDLPGFLGSMSLDLFVIGDIRDLLVQGYREVTDQNGDRIVLALSAVGLATSLAPVVDWAPSLMKTFKRLGRFSEAFIKSLGDLAARSLRLGRYDELATVATDFGAAARKLNPGPLSKSLKHVDSPATLKQLARAARVDPAATYVIATGTPKRFVSRLLADGSSIGRLTSKLRRSSRLIKAMRKFTLVIPTPVLILVAVLSTLLALSSIAGGFVRRGFTGR